MLRSFLVLLVLGSAVLAGPVIRADGKANKTEENTVENSAVTQGPSSSASMEVESVEAVQENNELPGEVANTAEQTSTTMAEVTTTTAAPAPTSKPRKTITFDQRQEGKFNIRADLENFVIVVVPSSPSAGISLLDMLNRTGQKKQQKKKSAHRKGIKSHHTQAQKKSQHITPEVVVLDESQSQSRVENEEFIEGRTPYRVDISSSARSNNMDMPSPIYRVVRPFTFNVEQPTSSNSIRFPEQSGNYYPSTVRDSKALLEPTSFDDEISTNNNVYTILTNNNNPNGDGGIDQIEDNGDTDGDSYLLMEQPRSYLDLPAYPDSSFDSLEYPRSDIDMTKLQLQEDDERNGGGEWELKLLGAQEQCGPDRKRDSYGVCQFVTP